MDKKIITFGEIMLRLATPDRQRFSQSTSYCASFGGGDSFIGSLISVSEVEQHMKGNGSGRVVR
jgi:hypothetical protein